MLSPKQSGVLECHLSHISKNENYELCVLAGFFVTTGKNVLVVCLAGAQSLLRPEKKVLVVVWQVRDRYYDQKKSSSRLSGGCAIVFTSKKAIRESRCRFGRINISPANFTARHR